MKKIHANISEEALEEKGCLRDQIDLLRGRLSLLDGQEKVLMTMRVENGNSFRQIARLLGVDETTVARKIHRLARRLIDGKYVSCVRNRSKFTKHQMEIAKDYFLTGLSVRKIARRRQWSRYRVRKALMKVQGLMKGSE